MLVVLSGDAIEPRGQKAHTEKVIQNILVVQKMRSRVMVESRNGRPMIYMEGRSRGLYIVLARTEDLPRVNCWHWVEDANASRARWSSKEHVACYPMYHRTRGISGRGDVLRTVKNPVPYLT